MPRLSFRLALAAVVVVATAGLRPPLACGEDDKKPAATAAPKKAKIKEGARVAIVGDSITEQKLYSKFVADYLYACTPHLNAHVVQFGWSGERAAGFAARLDNDLMPFKPDVVTLCYGMNDGGYREYTPQIGAAYEKPLADIVGRLKKDGATVVVGSPGAVDQYYFRRKLEEKTSSFAVTYNANLAQLRDIARKTAEAHGMPFANVHDAMYQTMLKAQEKLGPKYHVCGADGFHPAANGQFVMAYAFLKALDLDGDLGTITIDPKGESTAANGHKVVSARGGTVEVESTRYPFCFDGDEKSPNGTRSIAAFLPFNEELNRLTLVVKNAPAEKVKVTWGKEERVFGRAELEKGVNLAAAFADHPLAGPFRKVDAAVARQQAIQTYIIKSAITNHRQLAATAKADKDLAETLAAVRDSWWRLEGKKHAAVKAAVVPVKHTIAVAPAE